MNSLKDYEVFLHLTYLYSFFFFIKFDIQFVYIFSNWSLPDVFKINSFFYLYYFKILFINTVNLA